MRSNGVLLVPRFDAMRGDYLPVHDRPITPADLHERNLDQWLVAWFLVYYESIMLGGGAWPDIRAEEIPSHGGSFHYAFFDTTVRCVAVVTGRVDKCGKDGRLARLYYGGDADGKLWETDELAHRFRRRESAIIRRINNVLNYCSGWREKRISYEEFTDHSLPRHTRTDARTDKLTEPSS